MKRAFKRIIKRIKGIPSEKSPPEKYFNAVYKKNYWRGQESRSGTGSEGIFAEQKIQLIKYIRQQYGIESLLDLGCGDFHWMKKIAGEMKHYHGIDIVKSVINSNQTKFGSPSISFQCLDLSSPQDQAKLIQQESELIICFDVIGHMLNEEVDRFLYFLFFTLRAKYFLVTNRRDENSEFYLTRPKSRLEGINIQQHPLFQKYNLEPIWQHKAQYPGDYFELYSLPREKPPRNNL